MPLTDRQILAAKAARDLVDMLPPQDFGNPKNVMAGIVTVLADYHQSVITAAPIAVAKRTNKLTLKIITDVCDELQDVVSRKFERDRASASHQLSLSTPKKPDETRRDEQVIDYQSRIRPMLLGAVKPVPFEPDRKPDRTDGRHAERVAAQLAARRRPDDLAI